MCSQLFNLLFLSILIVVIAIFFTELTIVKTIMEKFKVKQELVSQIYSKSELFEFNGNLKHELVSQIYSKSELIEFNGKTNPKLYLSIMGRVFDVTSGQKHYGPGKPYNFFIGKDATRSFVDGEFENPKDSEDVTGFSPQQLRSLNNWVKFYEKTYKEVGKLIGKYYEQDGKQTPYAKEIYNLIKKALQEETEEDRLKLKYPSCNIEWDLERGSHVWCSDQSGGLKRNWIGVPRKFFEPGNKNYRCACIREKDLDLQNIEEYPNCDKKSNECFFK